MARVNPIQVQKFLKGIDCPVSKKDLVKLAQEQGADENVPSALEQLPCDEFNSPNDVSEATGKLMWPCSRHCKGPGCQQTSPLCKPSFPTALSA
jgi:hypothetical protein